MNARLKLLSRDECGAAVRLLPHMNECSFDIFNERMYDLNELINDEGEMITWMTECRLSSGTIFKWCFSLIHKTVAISHISGESHAFHFSLFSLSVPYFKSPSPCVFKIFLYSIKRLFSYFGILIMHDCAYFCGTYCKNSALELRIV